METKIVNKKYRVLFVCVLLIVTVVFTTAAMAIDVCGNPFLWIDPTVTTEPVDIACSTGDVYVSNSTVNIFAGATLLNLYGLGDSTINIYGGEITGNFNFVSTDKVTVYVTSVNPIPGILDEGQTQIKNNGTSSIAFDLIGTYQDQTDFVISCILEADAVLNLNVPQTAPEIEVLPALHSWDFGDVEIGQSATVLVQIFNYGTADLNVSSVTLTGDADMTFTSGPATPLVIAPSTSIGVDFEVTFMPTTEGLISAVVQIVSDDADESVVEVALSGVGIVAEIPPTQQIQDILDYFDASVAEGTLQGYGPGNSSKNRLKALRNMIESASDLINAGIYDQAIHQLESIAKKTDGVSKPQDFVMGEAVAELNAKIEALIADLTS